MLNLLRKLRRKDHYYRRLVYNGEVLDNVAGKVGWEKIKYFDKAPARPGHRKLSWISSFWPR